MLYLDMNRTTKRLGEFIWWTRVTAPCPGSCRSWSPASRPPDAVAFVSSGCRSGCCSRAKSRGREGTWTWRRCHRGDRLRIARRVHKQPDGQCPGQRDTHYGWASPCRAINSMDCTSAKCVARAFLNRQVSRLKSHFQVKFKASSNVQIKSSKTSLSNSARRMLASDNH